MPEVCFGSHRKFSSALAGSFLRLSLEVFFGSRRKFSSGETGSFWPVRPEVIGVFAFSSLFGFWRLPGRGKKGCPGWRAPMPGFWGRGRPTPDIP